MVGYIAAVLSAVFQSSKDLVSKKLAFSVDGTTSAFASFVYALPFYLVIMAVLSCFGVEWWHYSGNFVLFIVLRSMVDTIAETLKMHALSLADVSLLACVFAFYPLILLVLSPVITGDPLQWNEVFGIFCVVAGSLVLVVRPDRSALKAQRRGVCIALVSGVFFALNTCLDRLAAQQSSAVFSGFLMTLLASFFILPFMFRPNRRRDLIGHYRGFLLRGFFEAAFMICRLWALQYYSGPLVVSLQRLSFVISIVGGRILFKEGDFLRRLVAGMIVVLGAVVALVGQH